jgi:acyl-coenzyme A synthetase/AMP-(fatty) acid ligase
VASVQSAIFACDASSSARVCFDSGAEYSGRELAAWVEGLARRIEAEGVGRWLVYNADAMGAAIAMLALARTGGCAVLAPNAQAETLRRLSDGVRGALLESEATDHDLGVAVFAATGAALEPEVPSSQIDPRHCIAELQTSGTTAAGKSVSKEVRHLADEVSVLERCFGARLGRDVSIFGSVLPQHIYGLLFRVLWPLASARPFQADTLLLPQELLPRMLARTPCALVTTPVHLDHMVRRPEFASLRGSCRAVFSSGAPLAAATRDAVARQLGEAPIEILGSTETGGIGWRQGAGDWTAFPGVEVGTSEDGRLVATSARVSVGEVCRGERRRFRTGDLCTIRDSTHFTLLGRADRVVKIAGKRLALSVMEAELASHALVQEAALVALERGAEARIHAVLVPSEAGRSALADTGPGGLREALLQYLAERFDRVLLPRAIRWVAALPRDAQGKLPVAALRALFTRVTEPESISEERAGDALVRRLRVPHDLAHCEGHFPGQPMVPGVVMLSWAMSAAGALLMGDVELAAVDVVKFPTPLLPGQDFELRVECAAGSHRLRFELRQADLVFATGRCTLHTEGRA